MKLKRMIAGVLVLIIGAAAVPSLTVSAAETEPTVIPYEQALRKAYNSIQRFKDLNKNINDAKKQRDNAQQAFGRASGLSDRSALERNYLEADARYENLLLDKESQRISLEVSFRNSLARIAGYELDISMLEATIAQNEKDLARQKQLLEYGMTSENNYKSTEQNMEQNRINLDMLQITIANERQSLNQLLNRPLDDNIRIEYEVTMEPLPERVEPFINSKCKNDASVKRKEREYEMARFDYANNKDPQNEKMLEISFKQARRVLNDTITEVELVIRNNQKSVEKLLEQRESIQLELEKAIDDQQKIQINADAGLATQYDVESMQLAILNKENELIKNQYDYWKARFTFDYPYLSVR